MDEFISTIPTEVLVIGSSILFLGICTGIGQLVWLWKSRHLRAEYRDIINEEIF